MGWAIRCPHSAQRPGIRIPRSRRTELACMHAGDHHQSFAIKWTGALAHRLHRSGVHAAKRDVKSLRFGGGGSFFTFVPLCCAVVFCCCCCRLSETIDGWMAGVRGTAPQGLPQRLKVDRFARADRWADWRIYGCSVEPLVSAARGYMIGLNADYGRLAGTPDTVAGESPKHDVHMTCWHSSVRLYTLCTSRELRRRTTQRTIAFRCSKTYCY